MNSSGRIQRLASALLAVSCGATNIGAQSRQLVGVQGSALVTSLSGEAFDRLRIGTGMGGEFQIRVNPGFFSLGAGVQVTQHRSTGQGLSNKMSLVGYFVEPRYLIPLDNSIVRPYLAGRIARLRQSTDLEDIGTTFLVKASATAIGGGGGFVAKINQFIGFDLGLAATTANFGTFRYRDTGLDSGLDAGSGVSFVVKAGLNIGIGIGKK